MELKKVRVGITQGDTNGVGYELIFKTFSDSAMYDLCTPIVYGSTKIAAYHRKALESTVNFNTIDNATEAQNDCLNLVNCFDEEIKIEFGVASKESGVAALTALERAVSDYKAGLIDVIVTAPINKSDIQSETFHFPGHTEYFAACVGEGKKPLMVMLNETTKIALLSTHVPIADVAKYVTAENIIQTVELFNKTLKKDFRISIPRIAVLGLNPHCGDDGVIGTEEKEIIAPAIQTLSEKGIHCFGPFAADGFFGSEQYEHFDGVLAMYHDQGLAPFKTLSMNNGVNFTAGLPLVRTSPDHGVAYDIAGKSLANENSFRQSIYTAIDIWRNRNIDDEASKNKLQKLYKERREDERSHSNSTYEKRDA